MDPVTEDGPGWHGIRGGSQELGSKRSHHVKLKPPGRCWGKGGLSLPPPWFTSPSLLHSESVVLPLEWGNDNDLPWLSWELHKLTESSPSLGERVEVRAPCLGCLPDVLTLLHCMSWVTSGKSPSLSGPGKPFYSRGLWSTG